MNNLTPIGRVLVKNAVKQITDGIDADREYLTPNDVLYIEAALNALIEMAIENHKGEFAVVDDRSVQEKISDKYQQIKRFREAQSFVLTTNGRALFEEPMKKLLDEIKALERTKMDGK